MDEQLFELTTQLKQESCLQVQGEVRAHPKHEGEFEVGVTALEVIGQPAWDYPIS